MSRAMSRRMTSDSRNASPLTCQIVSVLNGGSAPRSGKTDAEDGFSSQGWPGEVTTVQGTRVGGLLSSQEENLGGGGGGGVVGWGLPLVHPSKPPDGHSRACDKAFLVTPSWQVLELEPGVLTPSEIRRAFGLSVKTGFECYKESVATSYHKTNESHDAYMRSTCGGLAIVGRCENGHVFAKQLLCGREWCATCGQDWSSTHQRRFSRMLPKAQQIESMGYFVIEWPIASRDRLRSKQALSDVGKRVKGAFQALGYKRGLRRWHYFGDKGRGYNPHLNVLVDGGYLSAGDLESVKMFLRAQLGEPQLIVNYHYRQTVSEKVHSLKYITRATFLDRSWDEELAAGLYNFQNGNYWGRWQDAPAWSLDDLGESKESEVGQVDFEAVAQLQSGLCPCCSEPLTWKRKKDVRRMALDRFGVDSRVLERVGYGVLSPEQVDVFHQRIGPGSFAARIAFVQQFKGHDTEPNLCPMAIIESSGAVPLGAGYWRLPDERG